MKNITLTSEELKLIGTELEMLITKRLRSGMRNHKDFATLKALRDTLHFCSLTDEA